jgi:hypothetical protein
MDNLKKIQYHTGYYHATVTAKHKDANVMPNLDRTYFAYVITQEEEELQVQRWARRE